MGLPDDIELAASGSGRVPIEVDCGRLDPSAAARVRDWATQMWAATSGPLLEETGHEVPSIRVLVAEDVWAAARREAAALGLGPDRREGPERVGGVVAGKCLRSDDDRHATVVVPETIMAGNDGIAQCHAAAILAHELCHAVYAVRRRHAMGATEDVWLPWDVAGMISVVAAEEYRVDRLALILTQALLNPTDVNGTSIPLASVFGSLYFEGLSNALHEVSPGLDESVWSYRTRAMDLDALRQRLTRVTEGIANYIAHVEAYFEDKDPAMTLIEGRAVDLLEPFWAPWIDHLRSAPLLPGPNEWAADRAALWGIGSTGIQEAWRRLGITTRPEGGGFYMAVDDPARAHPGERRRRS
ncbi:hypothetical protein [Actinomarinicola tropica]|uniref:Uncharacterized protein n=1 Tax=Actinomarinicola tropica TaxID=2789776 RepID=A0A5Q2RDH7_9ACTN|nr:hypothetical protein [Actinomarinicola tropica]QGG94949.1 hypothetical protein GH723_07405 [Actinomarinicola tropica]